MNGIEAAENLLQSAYNHDIGEDDGVLDIEAAVERVGCLNIHHAFFGPISTLPGIREHLEEHPYGIMATLLRQTRDMMVQTGEESKESLNRKYFLKE